MGLLQWKKVSKLGEDELHRPPVVALNPPVVALVVFVVFQLLAKWFLLLLIIDSLDENSLWSQMIPITLCLVTGQY